MISAIGLGEILPLSFQINDYNAAKYVRAYLYNADLDLVGTADLSPLGALGMYGNNAIEMPDTPYLFAQYIVYDDSGYNTLSTSQGGSADTFVLDGIDIGDDMPLAVQLFDYDDGKYIRATVRDANEEAITGSPVDLEPVGLLGLYVGTVAAPDSIFAIGQYIVYDDSGYTTVSSSQGGSSDTFFFIGNAPFDYGNVPDVRGALLEYFQPMTFTKIVKSVQGFQNKEAKTNFRTQGTMQPFTPQQLKQAPEGMRKWIWQQLHALPDLVLSIDDRVKYKTLQYRVMSKGDYSRYGYVEYHLIEDYQ